MDSNNTTENNAAKDCFLHMVISGNFIIIKFVWKNEMQYAHHAALLTKTEKITMQVNELKLFSVFLHSITGKLLKLGI